MRDQILTRSITRRDVLTGTAASTLAALAATRGGTLAADDFELEFWTIGLKGPFTDWVEGFIADFKQANPSIAITWVDVPGDAIAEKYLSAVAAEKAPDVANIYALPRFVQANAVVDVSQYVTPEEQAEFFEAFWDALSFGGGVYGIPWYANTRTLVYSKQMFRDAGLDPEQPPTTFAEAIAAAKTIREQTDKYGISDVFSGGFITDQLQLAGIEILNEDRSQATLNTPEAAAIVKMWVDAYQGAALPPEATTGGDAVGWFLSGRAAMFPGGAWVLNRTTPDVIEQLDFGVANGLVGEAGKYWAGFQYLAISSQSEHPAEAVKFALHAAKGEYQLALAKQVAVLPSVKSPMDDPFWTQPPQDLIQEATLLSAEQLDNALVTFVSAPPVVAWQEMVDEATKPIGQLMNGDVSPADYLAQVETAWNQLLAEPTS